MYLCLGVKTRDWRKLDATTLDRKRFGKSALNSLSQYSYILALQSVPVLASLIYKLKIKFIGFGKVTVHAVGF